MLYCNLNVPIPKFVDNSLKIETSTEGKRLEYFMEMLCTSDFSIPISTNWALIIEIPNDSYGFLDKIIEVAKTHNLRKWEIGPQIKSVMTAQFQSTIGCIFAQAIKIPGHSLDIEHSSTGSQSYAASPLISKVSANPVLEVTFLETNTSFTDFFLRPWLTLIQYSGLVARSRYDNNKCTFKLIQFKKTQESQKSGIRKVVTFNNVTPMMISEESLEYNPESNNNLLRQAQFSYTDYTITTMI